FAAVDQIAALGSSGRSGFLTGVRSAPSHSRLTPMTAAFRRTGQDRLGRSAMAHRATIRERAFRKPRGLGGWLTTVDHKRIGILYFVSSFLFFLVGGLMAMAMRTQLIVPD